MGVTSCILKLAISIVNFLLFTIGFVLVVIGAILLWGVNFFIRNIYDLRAQALVALKSLNITTDATGMISLVQQNSASIGIIAFCLGLILISAAVLGIVTLSCCSVKNLWILICVFLIAIAFSLIVLTAFFGTNKSDRVFAPLIKYLQNDVINKYQNINSTQPESIFVNVIQIAASCCGLYNYTDFNTATNFSRFAFDSSNKKYNILFPLSCCNYQKDFTITQADRDSCIRDSVSSRKDIGCWKKIQPHLAKYLDYCFVTSGITIAILIATIITTIILIILIDKVTDNVTFRPLSMIID